MTTNPLGVVITRSQAGNEELSRRLRLVGMDPISIDTISIAPPADWRRVDHALRDLHSFDWVVFTSPSGVDYFGKRMKTLSLELPWEGKPDVAAVGRQTATALSSLGLEAGFVPSSFTTSTLGEELPLGNGGRVLLLRSDLANPALGKRLVGRGFTVQEAAVYRTVPANGRDPRMMEAGLIVFASPSAVRSFCSLVKEEELQRLKGLRAVCIGPVTESEAKRCGFANTIKPRSFTIEDVVEEIARLGQSHD